jgi:hypothetical protein
VGWDVCHAKDKESVEEKNQLPGARQGKEGKVRSVKKDERKEGICFVVPPSLLPSIIHK